MAGTCHDEQVSALDVVIDPDFEPQKRPRSCTWPLPRPESNEGKRESTEADIPEEEDGTDDSVTNSTNNKLQDGFLEDKQTRKSGPVVPGGNVTATDKKHDEVPDSTQQQTAGSDTSTNGLVPQPRKSSARRNAWGNYSYADLITQAIESSPEKRLTLAQIYDWMVRSVPYFKDKGDSNSSAGWKNSIRHNLSLHSRFVRVQNEGTGKSSWWMVNPEGGKGGKAPRRRAVSMDNNSKYLKGARGRAAKKKATLQAAQDGSSESSSSLSKWTGSPTSRSSDELDAWTDFRSRTNSNASTISGRLSPILANLEIDEVPDDDSPLSPMLYSSPCSMSPSTGLTELPRLADLTGTMNLNDGLSDNLMDDFLDGISLTASQPHSPGLDQSGANQQGSPAFTFSNSLGGPSGSFSTNSMFSPTSITGLRQSPMQTIQENKQTTFSSSPHFTQPILQDLLGSGAHSHSDVMLTQTDPLMSQASASVSTQHSRRSALLLRSDPLLSNPAEPGLQKSSLAGWQANGGLGLRNESNLPSLIKDHLQQSPIRNTPMQLDTSESFTRAQLTSQDRFSSDLDLDVFSGSLECDMDTIISHDVLDDSIELNFDSHLISSGNLNTGNFSNSKQTSSSNWVPG